MYELHLRQLEARRVREATPLAAAEVALRARVHVRVRAGPRLERARPELTVVRQPRRRPSRPASEHRSASSEASSGFWRSGFG